jgi:dTDP-4-dehydrorhamnose 3,5-epimerase
MLFTETELPGAFIIELDEKRDDRGFFARTYCAREFEQHGLVSRISQCNLSFNHRRGTLRGLHYQNEPTAEAKYVRCIAGAIFQVMVDLRPGSPTFHQYVSVELSAANRRAVFLPRMFAAGYQTLADNTEVLYQVSEFFTPESEGGLRYDEPAIGIEWPLPIAEISAKDQAWPYLPAVAAGAAADAS